MKELRRLAIAVPAALLVLCLAASWWTRGAMAHMPFLKANGGAAGTHGLVDQRPWQTIESLAPLAVSADALAVQQRVTQLQALVKEDQSKVDALTASLKQPNGTTASSDDLDAAKAQLQLDTDELGDATEQLSRASGDKRGQTQQELTARQAAMKKYEASEANPGGQIGVLSARRYGTLYG